MPERERAGPAAAASAADPGAVTGDAPTALDPPYDRLARLPRGVWLPTLVAACGSRSQRLDHAAAWLTALGAGRLPPSTQDFGDAEACGALRAVVAEHGLPAHARGLPALAEQVLRTLLWHLDRLPDLQPRLSRAAALAQVVAEFREAWRTETAGLETQWTLLRELAAGQALHWDVLRGLLRRREWDAARQAAARMAALPELAALLQRIGRRRPHPAPPRPLPQPSRTQGAVPLAPVETRLDGAPGNVIGIRQGAGLERMLPAEAMLLRHPVGRRLWHARRAEARLLALHTEAVLVDHRPDPSARPAAREHVAGPAPLARGPILLALDTSGSMRGAPEQIAKAVAVAALRVAQAERRGLKLLAFGGDGELLERDLDAPGGLAALWSLLGQSFDGGTDLQAPIERAAALAAASAWAGADLLLVSDGEFGCTEAALQRLDGARRERGLQVHGVLVGDRETMGMLEVCDEIHWVRDWRRHAAEGDPAAARAETRAALPVHSRSLTALYFPNALSPRAARTVARAQPGTDAASALRDATG